MVLWSVFFYYYIPHVAAVINDSLTVISRKIYGQGELCGNKYVETDNAFVLRGVTICMPKTIARLP